MSNPGTTLSIASMIGVVAIAWGDPTPRASFADRIRPRFVNGPVLDENPSGAVPLSAVLSFEADEPVRAEVTVADDQRAWDLEVPSLDTQHTIPIVGVRAGQDLAISLSLYDAAGELPDGAARVDDAGPARGLHALRSDRV